MPIHSQKKRHSHASARNRRPLAVKTSSSRTVTTRPADIPPPTWLEPVRRHIANMEKAIANHHRDGLLEEASMAPGLSVEDMSAVAWQIDGMESSLEAFRKYSTGLRRLMGGGARAVYTGKKRAASHAGHPPAPRLPVSRREDDSSDCDDAPESPERKDRAFDSETKSVVNNNGHSPFQRPPAQGFPSQRPHSKGPSAHGPPAQNRPTQGPPSQGPPAQGPPTQNRSARRPPSHGPAAQNRSAQRPPSHGPPAQNRSTQGSPAQGPPTQRPPTQGPPTQRPPTQRPLAQHHSAQRPPSQGPPAQNRPAQRPPYQAPPATFQDGASIGAGNAQLTRVVGNARRPAAPRPNVVTSGAGNVQGYHGVTSAGHPAVSRPGDAVASSGNAQGSNGPIVTLANEQARVLAVAQEVLTVLRATPTRSNRFAHLGILIIQNAINLLGQHAAARCDSSAAPVTPGVLPRAQPDQRGPSSNSAAAVSQSRQAGPGALVVMTSAAQAPGSSVPVARPAASSSPNSYPQVRAAAVGGRPPVAAAAHRGGPHGVPPKRLPGESDAMRDRRLGQWFNPRTTDCTPAEKQSAA